MSSSISIHRDVLTQISQRSSPMSCSRHPARTVTMWHGGNNVAICARCMTGLTLQEVTQLGAGVAATITLVTAWLQQTAKHQRAIEAMCGLMECVKTDEITPEQEVQCDSARIALKRAVRLLAAFQASIPNVVLDQENKEATIPPTCEIPVSDDATTPPLPDDVAVTRIVEVPQVTNVGQHLPAIRVQGKKKRSTRSMGELVEPSPLAADSAVDVETGTESVEFVTELETSANETNATACLGDASQGVVVEVTPEVEEQAEAHAAGDEETTDQHENNEPTQSDSRSTSSPTTTFNREADITIKKKVKEAAPPKEVTQPKKPATNPAKSKSTTSVKKQAAPAPKSSGKPTKESKPKRETDDELLERMVLEAKSQTNAHLAKLDAPLRLVPGLVLSGYPTLQSLVGDLPVSLTDFVVKMSSQWALMPGPIPRGGTPSQMEGVAILAAFRTKGSHLLTINFEDLGPITFVLPLCRLFHPGMKFMIDFEAINTNFRSFISENRNSIDYLMDEEPMFLVGFFLIMFAHNTTRYEAPMRLLRLLLPAPLGIATPQDSLLVAKSRPLYYAIAAYHCSLYGAHREGERWTDRALELRSEFLPVERKMILRYLCEACVRLGRLDDIRALVRATSTDYAADPQIRCSTMMAHGTHDPKSLDVFLKLRDKVEANVDVDAKLLELASCLVATRDASITIPISTPDGGDRVWLYVAKLLSTPHHVHADGSVDCAACNASDHDSNLAKVVKYIKVQRAGGLEMETQVTIEHCFRTVQEKHGMLHPLQAYTCCFYTPVNRCKLYNAVKQEKNMIAALEAIQTVSPATRKAQMSTIVRFTLVERHDDIELVASVCRTDVSKPINHETAPGDCPASLTAMTLSPAAVLVLYTESALSQAAGNRYHRVLELFGEHIPFTVMLGAYHARKARQAHPKLYQRCQEDLPYCLEVCYDAFIRPLQKQLGLDVVVRGDRAQIRALGASSSVVVMGRGLIDTLPFHTFFDALTSTYLIEQCVVQRVASASYIEAAQLYYRASATRSMNQQQETLLATSRRAMSNIENKRRQLITDFIPSVSACLATDFGDPGLPKTSLRTTDLRAHIREHMAYCQIKYLGPNTCPWLTKLLRHPDCALVLDLGMSVDCPLHLNMVHPSFNFIDEDLKIVAVGNTLLEERLFVKVPLVVCTKAGVGRPNGDAAYPDLWRGLHRQLLLSGTPMVLASWREAAEYVDEVSLHVMQEALKNVHNGPRAIFESTRTTMMRLMDEGHGSNSWGAFTLYGVMV